MSWNSLACEQAPAGRAKRELAGSEVTEGRTARACRQRLPLFQGTRCAASYWSDHKKLHIIPHIDVLPVKWSRPASTTSTIHDICMLAEHDIVSSTRHATLLVRLKIPGFLVHEPQQCSLVAQVKLLVSGLDKHR